MKCPHCGLINPDNAIWCDCGYDFQARANQLPSRRNSQLARRETRAAGRKTMLYGALVCIGGIIMTWASYTAAAPGGTFLITWGAVFFGGLQFLRGIYQYFKTPEVI